MTQQTHIEVMGAPGSPYTRKMLAVLRYRRIQHITHWGGGRYTEERPAPKVILLPTLYFPGALSTPVTDTTPIIARLETEHSGRSVHPSNPVAQLLNALLEDYGDEWMTKCMFHYRWAFDADARHAGPQLVFWRAPSLGEDEANQLSDYFTKRQIERLSFVGSNDTTRPIIEKSYTDFLGLLNDRIADSGYLLGQRPASCDFAVYGQLTQLGVVEPTSAEIVETNFPRVRAWIDRLEDLSGFEPQEDQWLDLEDLGNVLGDLLAEIGATYVPVILANAAALQRGEKQFACEVRGTPWTQNSFPYQGKCLKWLREEYASLSEGDRKAFDAIIADTGCEALFAS